MSDLDDDLTEKAKLTVEFVLEDGGKRRITYEPRADGEGWWRVTERYTDGAWRVEGREPLQTYEVALEAVPPPTEFGEQSTAGIIDSEEASPRSDSGEHQGENRP